MPFGQVVPEKEEVYCNLFSLSDNFDIFYAWDN